MKRKMLLCMCGMMLLCFGGCNNQENELNTHSQSHNENESTDETDRENEADSVRETESVSDTEQSISEMESEAITEQSVLSMGNAEELVEAILNSDYSDTELFQELYQQKIAQTDAPDFTGEWNRTNEVRGFDGLVSISGQDEEGFDFSGEFYYYSHSGVMEGRAYFVTDNLAVYQYENEFGDAENEEEFVAFVMTDDVMKIRTTGSSWELGFGMNVFADGEYTLGEPIYTNANILTETFSKEELAQIEQMLGAEWYEDYFVFTVEYGAITASDCVVNGEQKGVYYEAFLPTMGGYEFSMLISEDGSIYFYSESDLGWQTNVSEAIDFPSYELVEE